MRIKSVSAILLVCALLFCSCGRKAPDDIATDAPVMTTMATLPPDNSDSSHTECTDADPSQTETVSTKWDNDNITTPPASTVPPTTITKAEGNKTVTVTVPPGYTIGQIGELFESKGICSKADFVSAASTHDFSQYYAFVSQIPKSADRCYALEGYLFPDTYEYYTGMDAVDVVGKLLRGAQNNIVGKYSYPGMTLDEIVTLASIIEKEAGKASEMGKISSVFHNRLKSGMKLQSDATINYLEIHINPILDIDPYRGKYNTYKCAALPAGPIGSPNANSLRAAVNPPQTDYYYFVSDPVTGEYFYSVTFEEHEEHCKRLGLV